MKPETKPNWLKEVGAEPLPGYRLLEPLGRGGFGEVWKCEAPGGLLKAIKFVQGNHNSNSKDSANLEFQAIQWVKAVRHPFVLSIDRVEIQDGEMILVMELADCNLADRFAECRDAGQVGIDRDELLAYLCEAAEALDLINFQHGLQHLDIKPANLFLISGHIKVADFGLVNKVSECSADAVEKLGGLTPLYVAPELLRGQMSRHSDQYSLAIVYQELLTGTFPFNGESPSKLLLLHLGSEPDLSALSDADRPLVARALSKEPEHRFSSCLNFIHALVSGEDAEPDSGPAKASILRRKSSFGTIPNLAGRAESGSAKPHPTSGPQGDTKKSTPPHNRPTEVGENNNNPKAPETRPGGDSAPPGVEFCAHLGSDVNGDLFQARIADGRPRLARLLPNLDGPGAWDPQLLARLSALRHPALAPIEVAQSANGRTVLLTDPVQQTLQDRYRECVADGLTGIHRVELLGHLGMAASALRAMHRQHRLFHLALSPRSVLLTDGEVQLGDFGLAQLLWVPRRKTALHCARRYAAPELLQGAVPSPSFDAYSLAVIYAEMLTGVYPWPKRKRSKGGSGPGQPDLDWLPATDRKVIARALDADPRQRFVDSEELLDALAGAARPPEKPAAPPPPPPEPPAIVLFASLRGGTSSAGDETPPVRRMVTQIVLAETAAVDLAVADRLTYVRRKDRGIEAKFPVSVLPGMVRLTLDFFCERWRAYIVSQNERRFVLRMRGTETTWQRWLGREVGVEVCLELQPLPAARPFSSEAAVTIRPYGGAKHPSASKLDEMAPLLLLSLRNDLQTAPDQRGDVRWRWSKAVDVYPVTDDVKGTVGNVLEAKGIDVSFSGVAFWLPKRPEAKLAYLHFKTFPDLATYALLVRVVRTESVPEGGFKVGAVFAAAVRPAAATPARTPGTEKHAKFVQMMDSRLGD